MPNRWRQTLSPLARFGARENGKRVFIRCNGHDLEEQEDPTPIETLGSASAEHHEGDPGPLSLVQHDWVRQTRGDARKRRKTIKTWHVVFVQMRDE